MRERLKYTQIQRSQIGRFWAHSDMASPTFDKPAIVKAHDFFAGDDADPKVILASYFDGHAETSFAHCTNGVSRITGFDEFAALLDHFILMKVLKMQPVSKIFSRKCNARRRKLHANKFPVTSFDIEDCDVCRKNC